MRRLSPAPAGRPRLPGAAAAGGSGRDGRGAEESPPAAEAEAAGGGRRDVLTEYDHVVWVGDLNYRLELSGRLGPGADEKWPPPQVTRMKGLACPCFRLRSHCFSRTR